MEHGRGFRCGSAREALAPLLPAPPQIQDGTTLAAAREDDCAALAEIELGGQLDSTTATRLYQLSGGVPLVLRELIRLIRASGAITARRGVWSLTGRVPADTGLAHLVSVRLDELSAAQREAAEAVALAEPVELAVLERFTDQLAAEQLETLGLLVTSGEDGAETLRIAHPLYAELLLAGLREADISPAEAIAVQITRAMALILGSGRLEEVLAELGDVAGQPAPIQLVAAFAHLFAGTGPAAIAIAGPVLADERMPRPLRQRAVLCLAAGLTGTGQLDEAIQVAGRFTTAGPAVPELDPDFLGHIGCAAAGAGTPR